MYMKNILTRIVNFWLKKKSEKYNMTSVNLEKILEYLKIQES